MLEQLRHLGLSENEAKVYMAMLELGPSVVVEIARKAGTNRPTTYVQIESLKEKGLVSTQIKGKKQYFIAESPEKLELLIDNELKTVENKKGELKTFLPELLNLFNTFGFIKVIYKFVYIVHFIIFIQEPTKKKHVFRIEKLILKRKFLVFRKER